jgi:pimeloyl-ACP methyl ester carboxylesterase
MKVKLYSRVLGEEGAPHLVVLHGLLGSSDNWQTLGKKYATRFRVHLLDARNHGKSPHTSEHDYDLMTHDLLQYFDSNNIETASILGHSMGGKTVMMFTERHPDRVDKVIVADIAPRAYEARHNEMFDALSSTNPAEATSRREVELLLWEKLGDNETLLSFLMKGLHRIKGGGYEWRYNVEVLAATLYGVTDEIQLSMTTIPTLFIRGLNSSYVSDVDLENLEDVYVQLETADIEDAGHWLHAEKPAEFLDITLDFLVH